MSQLPDPDMPLLKSSARQVDMVQGQLSLAMIFLILWNALWMVGTATWGWIEPNPMVMAAFWFVTGTKVVLWCASALMHLAIALLITRGSEFAVKYMEQIGVSNTTALTVLSSSENVIPMAAHRKPRPDESKGRETDDID